MTLQTLKAELPVYGGYVIGRDGKVIFIKGAIPGEVVEVIIRENKKDYSIAAVTDIIESSPFRRQPVCKIFGICGGCHLQYIAYEQQVSLKEEILADTLRRTGGVEIQLSPSLTDKEFGYRHRGQFKISTEGHIGFYREGTREVVPVEECPVMTDAINTALQSLQTVDLKGARELVIISGDTTVALVKGMVHEDTAEEMLKAGISGVALDNGDSFGKDYIMFDLNGLKYSLTPWSFFQSHWQLNRKVAALVTDKLYPLEDKRVLDLYSGAGNFSLPLAGKAKEVIAVEENRYSIEDGQRNALLNGIKNCRFIQASLEENPKDHKQQKGAKKLWEERYDVVVIDPPRPGLTNGCLNRILEGGSRKLVYISCNPATLARDLKKMKDRYEIECIHMADFFPNTYHIEAIAFLNLKGT